MTWRTIGLVAAGGAIGSMLRYIVSMTLNQRLAPGFPWATLAINVSGSFAIGVVAGLALVRASWVTPDVRLFLATGILGGFTTFSAFSLELVGLVGDRAFSPALSYALASLVCGFLAAFGGLLIARSVVAS